MTYDSGRARWLQKNYLTVILTVLIGALIGYCLADWMGWIR